MSASSSPSPATKSNRGALGAIFLTVFLDLVGFSIIFPLFPGILEHYWTLEGADSLIGQLISGLQHLCPAGASDEERTFLTQTLFGGILGSLYSLLQFVFAPVWGRLSDRVGRRPVLLGTICGTALSYLLWVFSGSFLVLIGARLLGGAMAGNLGVATAAIADCTTRENRSKGMALIGVAFGLGFLVGPAIGGVLAHWQLTETASTGSAFALNPFSGPALLALGLSIINIVWASFGLRETLTDANRAQAQSAERPAFFSGLRGIPEAITRRTILINLFYTLAFAGMEFTLVFLATERLAYHDPRQMVPIFVFIGFVLILVQGGVVRRLGPKIGENKLALVGMFSVMASFSILAFAPAGSTFAFYFGLFFMAAGGACAMPSLSALVSLYTPEHVQGRALGVFRGAGALGRAFGPIIAAVLFYAVGSRLAYLIGGLVILLPIALGWKLPRPQRH